MSKSDPFRNDHTHSPSVDVLADEVPDHAADVVAWIAAGGDVETRRRRAIAAAAVEDAREDKARKTVRDAIDEALA